MGSHPEDKILAALEAIEVALNTGKGKQLDKHGHELLDPRPVAPPVGYQRQPSMVEIIRAQVRSEALRQAAEAQEMDTFEESDDFDIGDDFDPTSPYENDFEPAIHPDPPPPENPGTQPQAGEVAPPAPPAPPAAGSVAPPAPPPTQCTYLMCTVPGDTDGPEKTK